MKLTVNAMLELVGDGLSPTAPSRFGVKGFLRRLEQLKVIAAKTPDIGTTEIKLPVQKRRRRTTKKKSPSEHELGTDATTEERDSSKDVTMHEGLVPSEGE